MKAKTILFLIIMLTASQLAYAQIPTCAGCGAVNPKTASDHKLGCPYIPRPRGGYTGGGSFQQEMMQGLLNNFMQGFNNGLSQQNNYNARQQAAAEQAAARAAAQAEAFRVHEEAVRVARIQRARHYRAEWDAREAEIGDRLGGAFDVITSTSLFGRPANPDADTVAAILGQDIGGAEQAPGEAPDASGSDPSVVDLRSSSLVVQLLRPTVPAARLGRGTMPARSTTRAPATSRWTYDLPEPTEPPPPPSSLNQLDELIAYFGPALGKYYWETVIQGTAKATLWGRVKNVRGMKSLSALAGFREQWKDGTEELGGAYTELLESTFSLATEAAYVLGNPNSDGAEFVASTSGSLDYQVRKLKVKISEMLFTGFTDRSEQIDVYELKTPIGEGNVVPLNDVPDHPDAYRLRSILFF